MLDLLKKRRSIRKFEEAKVEQEKIDALIKAALLAPSSRSIRPWEFIVVTDEKLIADLSKAKEHGASFLKDAPLAIVVLGDERKSDVWVEDTSIASILIQVMAETMGLGSCWIQIRERQHSAEIAAESYVKKTLDIPEEMRVESIIAIGYPDEEKSLYQEKDLLYEKVFTNKYKKN
ncbi:nitroreductase family protein [Clostridium formicaceticum]|uniref:5,6-dimethylbenzimidazole synthase n=1 Tax=Clostridium formicaceticum TaxID=1497 RepID=A0AAC9RPY7_9CLOT|nr:nitroreductase family protein [Clostridium formicaceticum]AOY77610.1 NAD(P)H nitroreductase [Clostridium formicaceticum]ARE88190.1 5,6-dimethylbenzimidazole synthase [Clostridium formicaceticum]